MAHFLGYNGKSLDFIHIDLKLDFGKAVLGKTPSQAM